MLKLTDISLKINKSKNIEVYLNGELSHNFECKNYLPMDFTENVEDVYNYFNDLFKTTWKDFSPKVANSISSDYYEYYDKRLENNGYLALYKTYRLTFGKPVPDNNRLYIFNKRRAESFIYDFEEYYKLGNKAV